MRRQIENRPARQPASLFGMRAPGHRVAADRCIGRDDAVEIGRLDHLGNRVHLGFGQVGRELEENRNTGPGAGAFGQHLAEQALERFGGLQVPETRRIGRRDVDRQIVGAIGEAPDAEHEIGDEILAVLVGADIDPDHGAGAQPFQALEHPVMTLIVEPHAVDHRVVFTDAEQAWARIARLRTRRHRADLDRAETEPGERTGDLGILVETGPHAERIGKIDAGQAGFQLRRVGFGLFGHGAKAERQDRRPVRPFGWQHQQGVARQVLDELQAQHGRKRIGHQAISPGRSQLPSAATSNA